MISSSLYNPPGKYVNARYGQKLKVCWQSW